MSVLPCKVPSSEYRIAGGSVCRSAAAQAPQLMWFVAWPLRLRYRFLILIIHFTLSLANSAALNNARKAPQSRAMVFQGLAVMIWGANERPGLLVGDSSLDSLRLRLQSQQRDSCFCSLRLNVHSCSEGNCEPLHITRFLLRNLCMNKTFILSINSVA